MVAVDGPLGQGWVTGEERVQKGGGEEGRALGCCGDRIRLSSGSEGMQVTWEQKEVLSNRPCRAFKPGMSVTRQLTFL